MVSERAQEREALAPQLIELSRSPHDHGLMIMALAEQLSNAGPARNVVGRQQAHTLSIRAAESQEDVASFAAFCNQYADWLMTSFGIDVSFQHFQEEMDGLPGDYAQPEGTILLASATFADNSRQDIGGVALRPFNASHVIGATTAQQDFSLRTCELKRLYVMQGWQQCGAGKLLTLAAVHAAQQMGYERMVLDTAEQLAAANKMYEKLNFRPCADYKRYQYPVPDVRFWDMLL